MSALTVGLHRVLSWLLQGPPAPLPARPTSEPQGRSAALLRAGLQAVRHADLRRAEAFLGQLAHEGEPADFRELAVALRQVGAR